VAGAPDGDWAVGEVTGLPFPANARALVAGGPAFLTRALRAWGALTGDNEVTGIDAVRESPGGSTGRKLTLSVTYAQATARLPRDIFVKFSRDFDDPVRDHGRTQMAAEVRFATLARAAALPVTVPAVLFADYHGATGTGVLITEQIAFGSNGIEPHYAKCLDHEMPDAIGHYRALLSAVARLAGADRGGRLPAEVTRGFPVDLRAASVGEPPPVSPQRAQRQVARYAEFVQSHPTLLPEAVRTPAFLSRLAEEAPRVAAHEADVWRRLAARPDLIALCHWNANVDNAWFWRDTGGGLQCGLLDWGCASRMNVAMAIWGALCGAETQLWSDHFGELLTLFGDEYHRAGGPLLETADLREHVVLYVAVMGVTWLLAAPTYLRSRLPDPVASRHAAPVRDHESVRAQLQMLTNVMAVWEANDIGRVLDRCLPG